ncbi:hypothetical protein KUCAC02_020532 [Chaenocephalus aceratus]|nr:hypothetical protein KUCAC02_020532 [Chaenocephalus aceratus]
MEKVLLIIIALSGLSAVSSHAERQYHFVSEAKSMSEAQRYCREKHTDLATVDSMEVVKLLNDMAGQHNQGCTMTGTPGGGRCQIQASTDRGDRVQTMGDWTTKQRAQ